MTRIAIDGERLTLENLYRLVFDGAEAEISPAARERMNASRAVIECLVEADTAVYGVNTGFGKMASTRISRDEIRQLQLNLVRSHACGVGAPLSEHGRARCSLCAPTPLRRAFRRPPCGGGNAHLNAESRRASGDSVARFRGSVGRPRAARASGAGRDWRGPRDLPGRTMTGAEAMRAAGIAPLTLDAKEGLALLNGTQAMLALAALALREAAIAADSADVAAALSLDALRGSPAAFDARIASAPAPGSGDHLA